MTEVTAQGLHLRPHLGEAPAMSSGRSL
jgi:hypothetical protein